MGMAEGYMIPDIPESNNCLYSQGVIDPLDPPRFTWNQKHGYNYVPPDIPFPGWIRFGLYFNERNS
jgi:hypothetical protein